MLRVTLSDLSRLPVERLAKLLMEWAIEDQRLLGRLHATIEESKPPPQTLHPASPGTRSDIIGQSAVIQHASALIGRFARTDEPVLITGESGTGKELAARAIHDRSRRRDGPFVAVNCAAFPSALVASELFGYEKGAFTGAAARTKGQIEHANGGTLFLDEITELPLESQSKLLRVLQEHEFEPVGSNRTVKVDVRVLAGTNRDLAEAVRDGRFRMDLYYRLHVIPVEVPPLRARREDIPALAAHFVAGFARQFGRRVNRISELTLRQLTAYQWPGNIRELQNFLARAVVLSTGEVLDASLDPGGSFASDADPPRSLEDAERRHIEGVLKSTRWVVEGPQGAAATLQMNASTLRSMMKRLGIQRPS